LEAKARVRRRTAPAAVAERYLQRFAQKWSNSLLLHALKAYATDGLGGHSVQRVTNFARDAVEERLLQPIFLAAQQAIDTIFGRTTESKDTNGNETLRVQESDAMMLLVELNLWPKYHAPLLLKHLHYNELIDQTALLTKEEKNKLSSIYPTAHITPSPSLRLSRHAPDVEKNAIDIAANSIGHEVVEMIQKQMKENKAQNVKFVPLALTDPPDYRRVHYNLECFAVDNESTTEVDDAICVDFARSNEKEICVLIHIADPSAIIPVNSLVDLDARQRSTTVYLPDRKYKMLPSLISEYVATLQENRECLALTFEVFVNRHNGDVLDLKVVPSIVSNLRRVTYKTTEDLLRMKDGEKLPSHLSSVYSQLNQLFKLALVRRRQRLLNGALVLPRTNIGVSVQCDPHRPDIPPLITLSNASDVFRSQILVEECMLLAGHATAKLALEYVIFITSNR